MSSSDICSHGLASRSSSACSLAAAAAPSADGAAAPRRAAGSRPRARCARGCAAATARIDTRTLCARGVRMRRTASCRAATRAAHAERALELVELQRHDREPLALGPRVRVAQQALLLLAHLLLLLVRQAELAAQQRPQARLRRVAVLRRRRAPREALRDHPLADLARRRPLGDAARRAAPGAEEFVGLHHEPQKEARVRRQHEVPQLLKLIRDDRLREGSSAVARDRERERERVVGRARGA